MAGSSDGRTAGAAPGARPAARRRILALLLVTGLGAVPSPGRVLVTQDEAIALAFPAPATVVRRSVFLTEDQLAKARELAGDEAAIESALVIRYEAAREGKLVGVGYVDTMLVRTLPASVLYVVTPESDGSARISRVEILSWDEPPDYLPRAGWSDQLTGKPLSEELSLKRAVRPITGATLTSRALTLAARRVLAIHATISSSEASR